MYGDTHPENDNQDAGLEEELLAAFDDGQDVDVTVDGEEEGEGRENGSGREPEAGDAGSTDTQEDGQPNGAQPAGAETFTLKYKGQEEQYTREQLMELAQKGRDYDGLREDRDRLRDHHPALELIDRYAARNNMTREQYLEFAQRRADEDEAAPVVRQLMEAGTPEAVARELALRRLQETRGQARRQQEQQAAQTREEQQRNAEAEKQAGYRALVDYANQNGIDLSKLPQEVLRDINAGMKPLEAYLRYENASLRLERSQREQNERNKDKNPGRVNDKAPAAVKDPFDDAFDEVFGL
ncbi:MAG: hypothetical protein PUD76_09410 [Clostridia bacterium]|nr:hypothetical protein [Clostridia bacterium]